MHEQKSLYRKPCRWDVCMSEWMLSPFLSVSHMVLIVSPRCFSGITKSSKRRNIFPQDKYFAVGSMATFCCFVPVGETFEKMYPSGNDGSDVSISQISNQTYGLTVRFGRDTIVNVKCKTSGGVYGASAFIVRKYDLVVENLVSLSKSC